ncbi:MAG: WG repeat-containing protein [Bacteroidota bacterium]
MLAALLLLLVAAPDTTVSPLYPVELDGRFGYIDREGKLVVPLRFDAAEPFSEDRAAVRDGDRWGYLGPDGSVAIDSRFDAAGPFAGELAPVRTDGLWGFIAPDGRMVVPPQYEKTSVFIEGRAPVQRDGLWGFIDTEGREVIEPRYTGVGPFYEGRAQVATGWKPRYSPDYRLPDDTPPIPALWGYVDRDGREVVPPRFAYGQPFSDGFAAVRDGEVWGYVDATGAIALESQYAEAAPFSEGLAWVVLPEPSSVTGTDGFTYVESTQPAFIRPDGSVAFRADHRGLAGYVLVGDGLFDTGTDLVQDGIRPPRFSEGLVALSDPQTGQWGFRDATGAWVIEPTWLFADAFENGQAWVQEDRALSVWPGSGPNQMLLSRDGTVKRFEGFQSFDSRFEGSLAKISFGLRQGYIDREGQTVIEPRFWNAGPFEDGIAVARLDGQPVAIDTEGQVLFQTPGRYLFPFSEGLAAFDDDGRWGLVRASGEIAVEPQFGRLSSVRDGLAVAGETERGPVGVIDTTGAWVLPPRYDDLLLLGEGLIAFHTVPESDVPYAELHEDYRYEVGRYGILDLEGREILPASLQEIQPFSHGRAAARTPYEEEDEGGWGYLAPDGTWAIEPQFVYVAPFSPEGLAAVSSYGEAETQGVIDTNGAFVLPMSDRYVSPFVGGVASAKDPETDLYGLIDTSGEWIVEPTFAFLSTPSEGRVHAIVESEDGRGRAFIDYEGRVVTPSFHLVEAYSEGLAAVRFPAVTGYVNEEGEIVWPRETR